MNTSNYLVINLVTIRRTVLAEFLTIFALKIIFDGRNRETREERKKDEPSKREVILPHRNLHKSQQITYQNAAN